MAKFRLTNFYRCLQESNFPICVDFLKLLHLLLHKNVLQFPYLFQFTIQKISNQLSKLVCNGLFRFRTTEILFSTISFQIGTHEMDSLGIWSDDDLKKQGLNYQLLLWKLRLFYHFYSVHQEERRHYKSFPTKQRIYERPVENLLGQQTFQFVTFRI